MTTFAWHVHHELIVEPLTEPIKYRVAYIRENKRADEIGTRLRLFKPVKGKLPVSLVEAGEVYVKACNALIVAQEAHEETGKARFKAKMAAAKAWAEIARDKAWKAYNEAREAHDEAGKTHNKA